MQKFSSAASETAAARTLALGLRSLPLQAVLLALLAAPSARGDVLVRTERELQDAFSSASPGETIVLANGRYVLSDRLHTQSAGSRRARITVRAASPRRAVIVSNGHESAVLIDQPYWTFQGLFIQVSSSSTYGFKLEGQGSSAEILDGVIALEPGAEAGVKGAGGPVAPQPDAARIEGNEIYFTRPTTYAFAEGIDAVSVENWVIRKNVIHGIRTSGGTVAYGAMTKGNSRGTIMDSNLVYDCFIGLSFGGGGTAPQWMRDGDTRYEHRKGIIRNNVVARSDDVGMYLYSVEGAKVYNNTIYGAFQTCGAGCSAIDVRLPGSADIRNNILDKPILDREGGSHYESSNIFLDRPGDPSWFVNVAKHDFRLIAGSTPVDRGEALRDVRQDMDGNARPSGGAFDIGASELVQRR